MNDKRLHKHNMNEKKVPLGLKIRPHLKWAIEIVAKNESRSVGNVAELLLEWAYEQLAAAGNTIELKSWRAQPTSNTKLVARNSLPYSFELAQVSDKQSRKN